LDEDQELRDILREKLDDIALEYVDPSGPNDGVGNPPGNDDHDDGEVEFRLFSGPKAAPTKIKFKSPEASDRPPGFIVPNRPLSYYFHGELAGTQKTELQACAVSGEDIVNLSSSPWPGCHLPWRVITTTQEGKTIHHLNSHAKLSLVVEKSKRSRLGKKARIAKRKKFAAKDAALKEKEASIREKKTKKNRAQKLKRREKERAKKAAVTANDIMHDPTNTDVV
jgi:Fungal protein of unknown function (DUF2011)